MKRITRVCNFSGLLFEREANCGVVNFAGRGFLPLSRNLFSCRKLHSEEVVGKFAKSSKRPVTLIELMVVLALIGSIAGVVGLSIKKALREQRFRNEVEEFVSALRLAQNLMVIADADIHVKVTAGADGIAYTLESERQLPAGWDKELAHASKKLKSIHHLSFNQSSGGAADFKFFSGGAVMSQGCIALSTDDGPNSLIRYIPLPGYPAPIRSGENVEEILDDNSPINSATILEVQSLQQTGSADAKEE